MPDALIICMSIVGTLATYECVMYLADRVIDGIAILTQYE